MILKANLKDQKTEKDIDDDNDSDWESVEEDAPVVKAEQNRAKNQMILKANL